MILENFIKMTKLLISLFEIKLNRMKQKNDFGTILTQIF